MTDDNISFGRPTPLPAIRVSLSFVAHEHLTASVLNKLSILIARLLIRTRPSTYKRHPTPTHSQLRFSFSLSIYKGSFHICFTLTGKPDFRFHTCSSLAIRTFPNSVPTFSLKGFNNHLPSCLSHLLDSANTSLRLYPTCTLLLQTISPVSHTLIFLLVTKHLLGHERRHFGRQHAFYQPSPRC